MSHYPFRGIYTEIAREEGVTRQAIQQAARKGNPRILDSIARKVEQRRAMPKKDERTRTADAPGESGKALLTSENSVPKGR